MTNHRLVMLASGLLLLGAAAACTWQGLRPAQSLPRQLYLVGELVHTKPEQVVAVAADQLSAGYAQLDLDALRIAVEALPWVAEATVRRRRPDAVVIRVREHQPVARWGGDSVVTAEGKVITPRAGEQIPGLPQLSGPPGSAARLAGVLARLQARLAPTGLEIAQLSLDPRGSWSLTLDGGLVLRLGRHAIEPRLERFVQYAQPVLGDRLRTAAYVDLRYADGFAVGAVRTARAKENGHDKTT